MLNYPIDIEATKGRWHLHDTDTGETAKMSEGSGNWANGDGTEILGLGSNLIPLLETAADKPSIDTRLHRLVKDPVIDLANNAINVGWNIVARSKQERLAAVSNIESNEFGKHFDYNRLEIETCLILTGLIRKIKNLNVSTDFQARLDAYQDLGEKIYLNRQSLQAVEDVIEADGEPNLDGIILEPVT